LATKTFDLVLCLIALYGLATEHFSNQAGCCGYLS
jgi:hypothetical protein